MVMEILSKNLHWIRNNVQKEVENLKSIKDLEEFEKNVSNEGKQIAESILKDLRNNGEDITPGMKKALTDLGIDQEDLKEPPMTKKRYLDKMKRKARHEQEIEEKFEKKYGIKRQFKGMSTDKLQDTAEKIEHELDTMTEEEKRIIDYNKVEYDNTVDYEYPGLEDPDEHFYETYQGVK